MPPVGPRGGGTCPDSVPTRPSPRGPSGPDARGRRGLGPCHGESPGAAPHSGQGTRPATSGGRQSPGRALPPRAASPGSPPQLSAPAARGPRVPSAPGLRRRRRRLLAPFPAHTASFWSARRRRRRRQCRSAPARSAGRAPRSPRARVGACPLVPRTRVELNLLAAFEGLPGVPPGVRRGLLRSSILTNCSPFTF